jgi:hypothetical protein
MSLRVAFGWIIFVRRAARVGREKKTVEAHGFVSRRRRETLRDRRETVYASATVFT